MSWLVNPYMLGASIEALGGEISYIVENNITYAVHTFKVSDKFRVLRGAGAVDYLLVAGGGSGGCGNGTAYEAGGGGGGGVLTGSTTVSIQDYSFTVGAGGVPSGGLGANGGNTTALGLTAIGGGRGATGNTGTGGNGGSGGGGAHSQTAGGTGTAGQGYAGETPPGTSRGGGGGGAGEAGGTDGPGSGGDGLLVSINGVAQYFGGGGAAYSAAGGVLGTPGLGGGGTSTSTLNGAVGSGLPNTGGGGGAAYSSSGNGGSGGSGVVIVRYPVGTSSPTYGTGGTVIRAYNDSSNNRWMVHLFTTTGASSFKRLSGSGSSLRYIVVGGGGQGGSTIGGGGGGGGVLLGNTDGEQISINVGDSMPTQTGAGGTGGPAGEGAGGDGGFSFLTLRQNYILNPNLETNATNWSADTGFSVARSTAQAWEGTASLLVTATSNTTGDLGAWQSTRQAVIPGKPYTYSFYARRGTGSRNARLKFRFFDASGGGNNILDVTSSYVTLSSGSWTRVSHTVVAPMGGTWVGINFDLSSGAVNDTVYVDGILFENSATLNSYFDGNTATSGTYPYERHWWTGTVNGSVSSQGIYALGGTGGNKGSGFTGGSGGGGGRNSGTASLGTPGQGNNGSPGFANDNIAGAGGGATAVGGTSTATVGGNGGAGLFTNILAGTATFGSGGGAGVRGGNTLGTGGTSAGNGGDGTTAATAGGTNRGGGGGGAGYNGTYLAGGAGGTGTVVVRYRADDLIPAIYTPITNPMQVYYDFANPVCYNPHSPTTTVQSLGWVANTNGTLTNSPTWLPDYGGVMVFNGTNQYLTVASGVVNSAPTSATLRTYHGWMVGNGTIFGSAASAAGQTHIYVTLNGTTLTFNASYYGGTTNDGPNSVTVTPHASGVNFISLVKTAVSTYDLYFNGVAVITNMPRQATTTTAMVLGSPYSGVYLPLTVGMYWSHPTALTSTQILDDYNATKARYGH